MDPIPRIVGFPSLRQSSLTVSKQTHNTCYAHVIARCMRRILYTFYDIRSETILEEYYDEDNMDIRKYFEYIGMEMEDIDVLRQHPSRAIYNYYEHFSALVYLYFYNLAIRMNIVVFKDTNSGLNGGSVCKIFFRTCERWKLDDYDDDYGYFISILKAEKYKDEYLLRAVYAFIFAAGEDPHLEIACFKSNFFSSLKSEEKMIKRTRDKLTELDIDTEKTGLNTPMRLSRMVIKLCDYTLKHGYTCPFSCRSVEAGTEDAMLIVGRREPDVEDPTILYKIKNSWGSQCVGDAGFMDIRSGYVKLDDLSNKNCGLIVGLPTKLQQPNARIRHTMDNIVYGHIRIEKFNARIYKLFVEEETGVKETSVEEETGVEETGRVDGEVAVHPDILYRKTVPGFVNLTPLRQPSESVSNQTNGTCYAHVIARLMRRVLYTFYNIHSKTSKEWLYHEDNLNTNAMFRLINKERADPDSYYDYYEYFSAFVYLYFFNLAIEINIIFGNKKSGLDKGSITRILFSICGDWIRGGYDRFIFTMKAAGYKHEKLLIAVYDFLCATATDPHLELEWWLKPNSEDINEYITEGAQNKLTQLNIDFELTTPVTPDVLTRMIIRLCDYAVEHGYTCPYYYKERGASGHVVLIVDRREQYVEGRTIISYKIKNSYGSQCVIDLGSFMNIKDSYLQLEDIYDRNCGLIVVLPKKIKQPNEIICDTMNDIVYGDIENFNERIRVLFDEEKRRVEEEKRRVEEEKRRVEEEKERLVDGEVAVQVEEPRSVRPSSRSPGRKPRSPGRKSRSPGRKSRSPKRKSRSPRRKTRSLSKKSRSPVRKTRSLKTRSLGGKNTLKKLRAHKKYYTVRKRK